MDRKHQIKQNRLAMWDITYYCNLNCTHCYNQENLTRKISKHQLAYDIAVIDDLVNDGFDEINLAGGEPLSVPHIAQLVEHGIQIGGNISINTNGLLLTSSLAKHFAQMDFSQISVSLAGLKETTNAPVRGKGVLKRVQKNIQHYANLLVQADSPNYLTLNLSVTSWNVDEMTGLYSFCEELGVAAASVHLTQPMGAALDHPDVIENSSNRILGGFEKLIQGWGKDITLILDTRPATTHYLSRKYCLSHQQIMADCPAGDRNIYVQPNGSKLACKLQVLHKADLVDCKSISINKNLSSFVKWSDSFQTPTYCKTCPFTAVCTPCPLVIRPKRPSECDVALKRSEAYNKYVLNQPLHKAFGVQTIQADNGQLFISLKDKQFKLSNSGAEIWKAIVKGSTPLQVISQIKSRGVIVKNNEILDFIHDLRKRGLIKLENDVNDVTNQRSIYCMLIGCAR